jgi:hypothetical protein
MSRSPVSAYRPVISGIKAGAIDGDPTTFLYRPANQDRPAIAPQQRRGRGYVPGLSRRLPAERLPLLLPPAQLPLRIQRIHAPSSAAFRFAAKERAWQAVNMVMVDAHWEVGRVIVDEEHAGKGKSNCSERIVAGLSERLQAEFGKGFDRFNRF